MELPELSGAASWIRSVSGGAAPAAGTEQLEVGAPPWRGAHLTFGDWSPQLAKGEVKLKICK